MAVLYSKLSARDILGMNAVELGRGGFCFLVAELLLDRHLGAELHRLTDDTRERFAHVFVLVKGIPLDIEEFRTVDEMRFDYNDYSLISERVDPRSVHDFFYPQFQADQLSAARKVLSDYIECNPNLFPPNPPLESTLRKVRKQA